MGSHDARRLTWTWKWFAVTFGLIAVIGVGAALPMIATARQRNAATASTFPVRAQVSAGLRRFPRRPVGVFWARSRPRFRQARAAR